MKKSPVFKGFLLVIGCLCCSIATNWIMIPNGLATPGITGISMTVEKFTGINYALIYYVITILILIVTMDDSGEERCVQYCYPVYPVSNGIVGVKFY